MAEITAPPSRRNALPPFIKLDMTPLVDLAFLLLSFFILTTTLRREAAIELALGAGGKRSATDNTLTLLVSGNGILHAYAGRFGPSTALLPYGWDQVRTALHAVKDTASFTCIIRTHPTAKYKAVVRALDEVAFLGPKHYTVNAGLEPEEARALEQVLPLAQR